MVKLRTQGMCLSAEIWSMSVCYLVGWLQPCNNPSAVSLLLDTVVGWRQPRAARGVVTARAFMRSERESDAVDPRDRYACHLRWHGSGSGSPLRAEENADMLFNSSTMMTQLLTQRAHTV